MKRIRLHNSSGDTIVEVLIVLAVLSLAFAISTATATGGLRQSRNAEEHSQALGILSSQVELLRVGVDNNTINDTSVPPVATPRTTFCMTGPASISKFSSATIIPPDTKNDNFTAYPNECKQNDDRYQESVTRNGNNFELRVRWDGPGSSGRQQEIFSYRVHKLEPSDPNSISIDDARYQIIVKVKKITPDPGNTTPSCASNNLVDRAGTPVNVQRPNGSNADTQYTDASSTATFNDVQDNGAYKVDFSVPAGYESCSFTPATVPLNSAKPTQTVNLKIRPTCTTYISGYNNYYTFGPRRADLDGWYLALDRSPPPGAGVTAFVDGSIYGPGTYWYVFSGIVGWWTPNNGYYYIWQADYHSEPINTPYCTP